MSAGLSLSAARADNFYHPPDWDPRKESLDQHHGSHPLRERARKLDQGILVIRFEMPFHVWCDGCGELIGKGVRFNAEKQQTGTYLKTRVWSFTMRHHCGSKIVVRTDPKSCEYIVETGAKRKEQNYSAKDAQTLELPDDATKARLASDPFYRLEETGGRRLRVLDATDQVEQLMSLSKARGADGNDMKLNRQLKQGVRARRAADHACEARRKELNLPDHLKLLPETEADVAAATRAFAAHRTRSAPRGADRSSILSQDIFAGSSAGAPRCGQRGRSRSSAPHRDGAVKRSSMQQAGVRKRCKHDAQGVSASAGRAASAKQSSSSKRSASVPQDAQRASHAGHRDAG